MSQLKTAQTEFWKYIESGYDEHGAYMKVKEAHGEKIANEVYADVYEFGKTHRRPEARIIGGLR